jgi:hypothetical protein
VQVQRNDDSSIRDHGSILRDSPPAGEPESAAEAMKMAKEDFLAFKPNQSQK